MGRCRAVVVGAGAISGAWFPPLAAEKVEVAAVVDLKVRAAKERIRQFGLDCPASTDLPATLARTGPDFVVELTPPEAHRQVTCTASTWHATSAAPTPWPCMPRSSIRPAAGTPATPPQAASSSSPA